MAVRTCESTRITEWLLQDELTLINGQVCTNLDWLKAQKKRIEKNGQRCVIRARKGKSMVALFYADRAYTDDIVWEEDRDDDFSMQIERLKEKLDEQI